MTDLTARIKMAADAAATPSMYGGFGAAAAVLLNAVRGDNGDSVIGVAVSGVI